MSFLFYERTETFSNPSRLCFQPQLLWFDVAIANHKAGVGYRVSDNHYPNTVNLSFEHKLGL